MGSMRQIFVMPRRIVMGLSLGGLVMLATFAAACEESEGSSTRPPRTWTVQDGETRTFSPDEVEPDDTFRCSDGGGVDGVPPPGSGVGGGGEISVGTEADGTVTVRCEPGPPGNA